MEAIIGGAKVSVFYSKINKTRQACVELNDNTQRSFGETGGSLSKGREKSTGQSQFQNWKKQ